jgi:hypothetical protein
MSDPVREQHERDGFVSSTPFPQGTGPDPTLDAQYSPKDSHRPPVLGVLLTFIVVFWGLVAAVLLLR